MRILIATADDNVARALATCLNGDAICGELVIEGDEAVQMLGLYDYDVAIIDDTKGISGAAIVRRARAKGDKTPIILLATMDAGRIAIALDAGADDVIAKPFHIDELMARVRAIVRRSKGHAQSRLTIGALTIDIDRKVAEIDGVPVALTAKEYGILELLALRQGMVLTKETILSHLYGGRDEPEIKIIDVFVCKLRRKLAEASGGKRFVGTVWGRGYTLEEDAPPPPRVKPAGATRAMIDEARAAGVTEASAA